MDFLQKREGKITAGVLAAAAIIGYLWYSSAHKNADAEKATDKPKQTKAAAKESLAQEDSKNFPPLGMSLN